MPLNPLWSNLVVCLKLLDADLRGRFRSGIYEQSVHQTLTGSPYTGPGSSGFLSCGLVAAGVIFERRRQLVRKVENSR